MHGSPGYSKPTHQYGQSFGDVAEVLGGGELPILTAEAKEPTAVPPDEAWAGKGFDQAYQEENE